jgi:uncharacterized protein (DUF1501 family)
VLTRRDFLASGLLATSAGLVVPPVLAKGVLAATQEGSHNDHVLVVLQLAGGNDGLNTVVPYADPAYHDARPQLGVAPETVLKLDASIGLSPSLPGVKALYDTGRVALVQGVGYDKPTYSHFEALRIWQDADPQRRGGEGWLGRLLATQAEATQSALAACALGEVSTPAEMRAQDATVSVIESAESYGVQGGAAREKTAPALYRRTPGAYGALFDQALSTAEAGIAAIRGGGAYTPAAQYGGTAGGVGASLQLAAQMIVTQPGVKICHVALGGFDTHQDEDQRQAALLKEVDQAVSAFLKDLDAHAAAQRVVLMTWSEFGRRVRENGSRGTDHGSAAPMLVIGAPVRGGLYGEAPSLTDLDDGNLKHTTDFRSVYQAMLADWLGADAQRVLGARFPAIPLLRSA